MTIPTAVVGLGNIGGPIAARIAAAQRPVIGVDGDRQRRQEWAGRTGAPSAASIDEIECAALERVLVIVRTTEQALAVVDRLRAAAAGRAAGSLAVHLMTTLEPGAAHRLGDSESRPVDPARQGDGLRILEQPVSGGSTGAEAGTLTVLSAGPLQDSDREFLLATVAGRLIPFDRYGEPTLVKLVNNTLAALNTRSTARMLLLAAELGLDPRSVKEVVDSSSGASSMGAMIDHFADDQALLLTKDVGLLAGTARPLPVIDLDDEGFLTDLRAVRALLAGPVDGSSRVQP